MQREEFERALISKAARDEAFRKELLADPKGVLQRELKSLKDDFVLPANLQVSIVQETPDHIYLRLPVIPETLSDKELVGMAGGAGSTPTVTAVVAPNVTVVTSIDTFAVVYASNEVVVMSAPATIV